jgi:hypothetical protein
LVVVVVVLPKAAQPSLLRVVKMVVLVVGVVDMGVEQ